MIHNVRRRRLGDDTGGGFGQTCQPACSAYGVLCADPTSMGASLNPCCGSIYIAQPGDGYCGGGASPVISAITSQTGGLQDPCSAGGALCPQPNSPGATLNPCCAASAASAYGTTPTSSTSMVLLLGGGLLIAFLLLERR